MIKNFRSSELENPRLLEFTQTAQSWKLKLRSQIANQLQIEFSDYELKCENQTRRLLQLNNHRLNKLKFCRKHGLQTRKWHEF
ncbi:hypothetical protein L6452_21824 [Arctium lappa]|uniref:Uncharacterized protein n=1 Tax=Arctium lappa TaxID=4217 RepID=A0ACB9AYY3_ARCLA|nr:hypothetical protein L6452_21824 [Arctium lappa]